MAVNAVEDIKLTRAEQEKSRQREAYDRLFAEYPLPKNINELKSYAWGRFTWRDAIASGIAILGPVMLAMLLSAFLPDLVCVVLGIVMAIPLLFIANKHLFTGDLPIEDKVRIAIDNAGQSNLLSWDKTKNDGVYLPSSTQSFVPAISFTEDNFVMLRDGSGGFAVIQLEVDDNTATKYTEQLMVLRNFVAALNCLIDRSSCVPVQIYLKADQRKLDSYVNNALDDVRAIHASNRNTMVARASDYASLLINTDKVVVYSYRYYVVVTYREDAEGVGDSTMNTMSVRREQMKEKANPFNKQMAAAEAADFKIGEDRKAQTRRLMREAEFGPNRTQAELAKRTQTVLNFLNDMGSTHTGVTAHLLNRTELSKLVFDCFNEVDKYIGEQVLTQAVDDKDTLWSESLYEDYPDMFKLPKKRDKTFDLAQDKGMGRKAELL